MLRGRQGPVHKERPHGPWGGPEMESTHNDKAVDIFKVKTDIILIILFKKEETKLQVEKVVWTKA